MSNSKHTSEVGAPGRTRWRPLAHVALEDEGLRGSIAAGLRREGWAAAESRGAFPLLQSLAGPLLHDQPWSDARLVVVDAFSPGCSGYSIAFGMEDLGLQTSVVVVWTRNQVPLIEGDIADRILVVHEGEALSSVLRLARELVGHGAMGSPRGPDARRRGFSRGQLRDTRASSQ